MVPVLAAAALFLAGLLGASFLLTGAFATIRIETVSRNFPLVVLPWLQERQTH